MRAILVLLALMLAAPLAAQTARQVYVWKDAAGVTQYSQTPPARGAYQVRAVGPQPASTAPATAAAPAVSEACANARANLALLQDPANTRVGVDADGDGEPDAPLTAEERARHAELAQASIRVHCPPDP